MGSLFKAEIFKFSKYNNFSVCKNIVNLTINLKIHEAMFNFSMKSLFILSFWVLILGEVMFVEVSAQTTIYTTDNGDNNYTFSIDYPGEDPLDLVFWITPDGHWEYGHEIEKTLDGTSYDPSLGKAHVVKKDVVDFSISSHNIPSLGPALSSLGSIQTATGVTEEVQISGSWSPAPSSLPSVPNNWVFAIITITNTTGLEVIEGNFTVEAENGTGYTFSNAITPSWATALGNISGTNKYQWDFGVLQPNEQRHIFVAYDVAQGASDYCIIAVNGVMYDIKGRTTVLDGGFKFATQTYPHDPNFMQVDTEEGPELESYEFCQPDSEIIQYTIGFQNLGNGIARDVSIDVNIEKAGYEIQTLALVDNSHTVSEIEHYGVVGTDNDYIRILLNDINLAGLDALEMGATYEDTKGYVTFEIQTACAIASGTTFDANADITFIADSNIEMPDITTNTVGILAGQPSNRCITCFIPTESDTEASEGENGTSDDTGGEGGKQALYPPKTLLLSTISPNPCSDYFRISYQVNDSEKAVLIRLFDLTGRKIKDLYLNTQISIGEHQIIEKVVDLESGMYLVTIQVGSQKESHKLLKW